MKLLISEQEFLNTKSRALVPLTCEQCEETFYRTKHYIQTKQKNCKKGACFCSKSCRALSDKKAQIVICLNCNTQFEKTLAQINKFPNHFCCHSCATTYNNKHKTYGTRRSKLEVYLEEQIETHYSKLNCQYNKKDAIGSELDFYFPTLKLAIELNGIFHYEPIYGQDKLDKIQNNDQQKFLACYKADIELCVIDSSQCKYLTQKIKGEYWDIINILIQRVYKRHK